jgi:hypothetical protein
MRVVNFYASCAICGEQLDTNEASLTEVMDNEGIMQPELHVGTDHSCWSGMEANDGTEDERHQ